MAVARKLSGLALVVVLLTASGCGSRAKSASSATTPAYKPATFSPAELTSIENAIEEGLDDLSLIALTGPGESTTVTKKITDAGGRITYDASEPSVGYDGGFLVFTVRPAQAVSLVKDLKLRAVAIDRKFNIDFSLIKNNPEDPTRPNVVASGVRRAVRGEPNPYLPVHETGALDFRKKYGTDGTGATIAVVDTGVSLGHEGLLDKVIDWKDTTGEGDVVLTPASITRAGGKVLLDSPVGKLDVTAVAVDGTDNFRVGVFNEEQKIQGGDLDGDLNQNGTDNDKLAVVAFQKKDADGKLAWFAGLDNNLDGVLTADEVAPSYRASRVPLKLGQGANKGILQAALDIEPDGSRVNIGFDGGAHGTHVAGIASGNGLFGGRLDGAAPGAKVIAVKVLQTRGFGTDSMVMRGMIYAATHGADVINMSLGDREYKGGEDPEAILIRDLSERYGALFSISAGNSGPAIDTIGTPGASIPAITSGAYISADTYRANYGAPGLHDGLFFFSSVGPTVLGGLKPTIVSPGSAVSSVPNFVGGYAMYQGTSMAAPETTGALALLVAQARADKLGLVTDPAKKKFFAAAVKKAVGMSARPVADYSPLEQGYGLLDVVGAYEALKKIDAAVATGKAIFDYDLKTSSQLTQDGRGNGPYYRNANQVTSDSFDVTRLLPHGMTAAEAASQSDVAFDMRVGDAYLNGAKVDARWVTGAQPTGFGISGSQALTYNVSFDRGALTAYGAYCTRLDAFNVDTGLLETSLLATAVRPYSFTADTEKPYSFYFRNLQLEGGRIHRYFFVVPANATALSVKLHVPEGQKGLVRVNINDPAGTPYVGRSPYATRASDEVFSDMSTTVNALTPGVWEVDVYASFTLPVSTYSLRVTLGALTVQPAKLSIGKGGGAGSFSVRNDLSTGPADFKVLDQGFVYRERKSIQLGYRELRQLEITEAMLPSGAKSVPVTIVIDNPQNKEDALSAELLDDQRRPFVQTGAAFDQTFLGQTMVLTSNLKPGKYLVAISGDFVPKGETTYDYEERIGTSIGTVAIQQAGRNGFFDLYSVQVEPKATPPAGYGLFARVVGADRASQQAQVVVPVYLQAQ